MDSAMASKLEVIHSTRCRSNQTDPYSKKSHVFPSNSFNAW
jgi:hypothetical protein